MIKLKWYHYILLSPMIAKSAIEDTITAIDEKIKQRNNQNTITPLHESVKQTDIKQIKELLKKGVEINARDYNGATPLSYAVENNHLEIASLLLEKGADPNIKDFNERPIIIFAIKHKNLAMVKLLISMGFDAKVLVHRKLTSPDNPKSQKLDENSHTANSGSSLLYYACIFNPEDLNMLSYLIQNGVDINSSDEFGYTPLMLLFSYSENIPMDSVRLLIKKGANINAKKSDGQSILHMLIASKHSNIETIRFLVTNGANVNSKDKNGRTLFNEIEDYYDENQNLDIVNYLKSKRF